MTQGPVNLEESLGGEPQIDGRKVENPDNNPADKLTPTIQRAEEAPPTGKTLPGLEEKLRFIPKELHDRVRKLTRDMIAMPGPAKDPEAYAAYVLAEKMLRKEESNNRKAQRAGGGQAVPTTND